jgi:hypothetical protein
MPLDLARRKALMGGAIHCTVIASNTLALPMSPSPSFDQNHGNDKAIVFSGDVTVPDAPIATTSPAPWQAPFAFRIPLSPPIQDRGGHLCLEIVVGLPRVGFPPTNWVVDAEQSAVAATTQTIGTSCSGARVHAGVLQAGLRPGASMGSYLFAPDQRLCLHALGTSTSYFNGVPLPFDLTSAGAPGCKLYTDWLLLTAAMTGPSADPNWGEARASMQLPIDPNLLGTVLFSQWLLFEPSANALGLVTTHATHARLEPAMPAQEAGMVYAYAESASFGSVATHMLPVMRLVGTAQ